MMISRKKILSRSQSDMDYSSNYNAYQCDEDVWINKDKLYNDHIEEIFKKWDNLDDEIWAKIICMERNRRIAKAYARVPLLTINGADNGFDGFKIGLNGFDNPLEDNAIKSAKHRIGKGVRIKIDEMGSVIIKRLSTSDVMIRGYDHESTALSKDIVERNGVLPADTSIKLFDIKKFQSNITKELRSACPNRQRLEAQCIIVIGFVKDSDNILDLPVWCMLINIVALDMLKSRVPDHLPRNKFSDYNDQPKFMTVFDKSNGQFRPQIDEDPYSVPSLPKGENQGSNASNSSSNSAGSGPPIRNDPYYQANLQMNNIYNDRLSNQIPLNYMQQQHRLNLVNKNQLREKENNKPPELPPRDFNKQNGAAPKKTKTRNFAKVFRFRKSSDDRKKKTSSDEENKPVSDLNTTSNEIEYEDPYYCYSEKKLKYTKTWEELWTKNNSICEEDEARVSNFNSRQRKSLAAPVQGYINNMNNHNIRKANSNGYLNSLFNSGGNFYPNSKSSYYSPQYDSSFDSSDPYANSTDYNADYYAIYNGTRMHPNIYPKNQQLGYRKMSPQDNYHMQQNIFSKAERYAATEWD